MKLIITPITEDVVKSLTLGEMVMICGDIYTGRDAVLPRLVSSAENNELDTLGINLQGSVIFHTAVSPAGVGPTSSNKIEIESSIPALSKAGVKIHLGKGMLKQETIDALNQHNAVYAVIPPVTAYLSSRIEKQTVAAFLEQGMEALHLLRVTGFPAIISAIRGETLYTGEEKKGLSW